MRTFDNYELQRRVDEVLFYVWDPIGISDQPYARAEYEDYIPQILKLLNENDAPEPISTYLADIIKNNMELSPNKSKCDEVALPLLEHKNAIKDGCA